MIKKIQSLLTDNERVLHDARIHPIVFAPPIFYLLIALIAAVFFHPIMGAVIFFLTLYPIYTACIHYFMTHLVLTDKKVLTRAGFLTRDWVRMNFEKIENAYLMEPIVGRYFNYSTVSVSGVGAGEIAVPYVANGGTFVKNLEKQLEINRKSKIS